MLQKRSIAAWIVLSILSCGIGLLVWMALLSKDLAMLRQDPNYRSGGMVVLLTIVTCGIYSLYWIYVSSQDLTAVDKEKRDNALVNLLLSIFQLSLVALALMQNQVNDVIDQKSTRK